MSSPPEAPVRRPAPRSRTGAPTPWARPTRQIDRPRPAPRVRAAPPPVFVDDSGRRRRAGRIVGSGLAIVVFAYIGVVGLTFSGVPLIGRLAPPGVNQLSRPAGDRGLDVGPDAQVSALAPEAVAGADAASPAAGSAPGAGDDPKSTDTAVSSAAAAPAVVTTTLATTTTTAPGLGTSSTIPTPSSTVPEHTNPTGGPPTEPPGKP